MPPAGIYVKTMQLGWRHDNMSRAVHWHFNDILLQEQRFSHVIVSEDELLRKKLL